MPDGLPNVVIAAPPPKPWWKSRTIWFNAVMAALTALEASIGMLQPLVPVNVYPVIATVLIVGNAFLRIVTSQAIAFSGAAGSGPQ